MYLVHEKSRLSSVIANLIVGMPTFVTNLRVVWLNPQFVWTALALEHAWEIGFDPNAEHEPRMYGRSKKKKKKERSGVGKEDG